MLGTVERAGAVLDLFSADRPEWGPSAVARELSVAKSQAYQMLLSLCAIGLLRRCENGRYRLGWRTFVLRDDLLRSEFDSSAARAFHRLGRELGAAAQLVALDRDHVVTIARYGGGAKQLGTDAGDLHATASAKVLLALLSPGAAKSLAATVRWRRLAEPTLTAPGRLAQELARVRARGIAFELGDLVPGRWGAAVPVTGLSGAPIAALGIATDRATWQARELTFTRALRGTAANISRTCRSGGRAHEVAA